MVKSQKVSFGAQVNDLEDTETTTETKDLAFKLITKAYKHLYHDFQNVYGFSNFYGSFINSKSFFIA